MAWLGRPENADADALAEARKKGEEQIRGFSQYEQESHYTPIWRCPCGRHNECAVSTCNQCQDSRPPILHGDPEQGEQTLGLARMVARGQIKSMRDIPQSYYALAKTRRSEQGKKVSDYLFDTERGGKSLLSWENYVQFLLNGGRV